MNKADSHLRPTNISKDLSGIADLVELCFAETLDEDGRSFIRRMRQSGSSQGFLGQSRRFSPTFSGYVWHQDDRLVGNLSMIPVLAEGKKAYLIANVAVHPDYRGRGIAHELTQEALAWLRQRRVARAWLQVRDDNPTAIELYRSFGFHEKARRTVWHSQAVLVEPGLPGEYGIDKPKLRDWPKQKAALQELYPSHVRWNLPLDIDMFAPGLVGKVWRSLSEVRTRQWSLRRQGRWIGSLCWQSSYMQADWLWLAAPLEERETAIAALLAHARRQKGSIRTLALNYPAGEEVQALTAAGFRPHQTLIWMRAEIG